MIVLMCPHCGGKVERTDDRQYELKCPYCGGEVSFEAIRSNVEYNDLKDINVRMQQDDAADADKRKKLKQWMLMRNILVGVFGLINFLAWFSLGYYTRSGREPVFTMLTALLLLLMLFTSVAFPILLAATRVSYNAMNRQEDKGAKIKAFFGLLLTNVLVFVGTFLIALIVIWALGWIG